MKTIKSIAPSIIGGLALGPYGAGIASSLGGAAIGSGVGTLAQGGNIGDALKSGGLTYAGGKIGGLVGDKLGLGNIGSQFGDTASNVAGPAFMDAGLGDVIGQSASNTVGAGVANTSLGSAFGSYAGNSMGQYTPQPKIQGSTPFTPTRASEMDTPSSLSGLANFTPDQQSTNLATQGVYGGGLGGDEQGYFTNLINRQLIDENGNLGDYGQAIQPIEQSYLSQLGLGGYSNSKDLLEALSKWKAA